ncbi:MAG: PKD domain-containing protein [Candidatus Lutacidiplasmatales archaeon]
MRSSRYVTMVLAAVFVVVLFLMPTGSLPGAASPAHSVHSAPAAPGASKLALAAPTSHLAASLHPHPLVPCPNGYPGGIGYVGGGSLGSGIPIIPNLNRQGNCPLLQNDEIHASLFSTGAGSGSRFTIPLQLPAQGPGGQQNSYFEFYIGMVVGGDKNSAWGQSYAEISFTPNSSTASLTWIEMVNVFAFVNGTYFSPSDGCKGSSQNLSWNSTYWCEVNVAANVTGGVGTQHGLASAVPTGDFINVTFSGSVGGATGLVIYANDSTNSSNTGSYTLNLTNTGAYTFEPAFSSSCPDTCLLNWANSFGLGISFEVCPVGGTPQAICDSYNQSAWNIDPPPVFGSPEYFTGGSYKGDYYYIAPESLSGACSPTATVPLATCYAFQAFGGTGFYPFFSFNGSQLNFGTNWPWTLQYWGESAQYLSNAVQQDLQLIFLQKISNSSRGGFITTNSSLTVSAWVDDLGTVGSVTLSYSVGGVPQSPLSMSLVSGTTSDGTYNATIPSGANGAITYTITALSDAGYSLTSRSWTVVRGPLPHFTVQFQTSPSWCGSISFNGTSFANGTSFSTLPGTYPLVATECFPFVFGHWVTTSGLSTAVFNMTPTQLTVSSNGTVQGVWRYVRPHQVITIATNPSTCSGDVVLNNTTLSSGQQISLLFDIPVELTAQPNCGGLSFAGWTFGAANFSILGTTFVPGGNGTLTMNLASSATAFVVSFYTAPPKFNGKPCGGILYRGAGYVNNQSLAIAAGTYPIAPDPCLHWGWQNFTVSNPAALWVNSGNLTVNASGWVKETNFVQTWVTFVTDPPSCGVVRFDNQNYTNGSYAVVANNSTHSVFAIACAGFYLFSLTGTGGVHVFGNIATVNGSGDILAVFIRGTPNLWVGFITDPSGCGTIDFESNPYRNSNYTFVAPGTVATISTFACPNYGFVRWQTTGGITISGNTAYLNSSGSIEAVFRPLVPVFLYTDPSGCGAIALNGISYANNQSVYLPEEAIFTLAALPCPHYTLQGWQNTTSAEITGAVVTFIGGAVITAIFVPIHYGIGITVNPANCGQVRIGNIQAVNGTNLSLVAGNYSLSPIACAGDHLANWTVSGGVSVVSNNRTVNVNGSGALGAVFLPVSPKVALSVATSGYANEPISLIATVAVLVPPYDYNYTWSFGDGSPNVTTQANFTSHTYSTPGSYQVTVTVHDPYQRLATDVQRVSIVAEPGSNGFVVPLSGWLAIAIGVVAVLGFLGATFYRRPPARRAPESLGDADETIVGPEALETASAPSRETPKT